MIRIRTVRLDENEKLWSSLRTTFNRHRWPLKKKNFLHVYLFSFFLSGRESLRVESVTQLYIPLLQISELDQIVISAFEIHSKDSLIIRHLRSSVPSLEMALQETAHDACSRKIHCVTKKYLDDPFVSFFAKDNTIVNSPLMNRGTWLRTTAIENCVRGFAATAGHPIQIISFGAGMDTLYFRLKHADPTFPLAKYVELDFADLVAEKQRKIAQHEPLRSLVSPEYALLPCDLYDIKGVTDTLKHHLSSGVPTVMIAEMVFVYIEAKVTTELLRATMTDVIGMDNNIMLITYDAIRPFDRFGQVMVESLQNFGAQFKGIKDLPTPEAHAQRCKDLGFKTISSLSMKSLYLGVPRDIQIRLNKLEMIDDWDEWNLMHDHYGFVVASTLEGDLPRLF